MTVWFCRPHAQAARRYGHVEPTPRPKMTLLLLLSSVKFRLKKKAGEE
jgi:hypothetical protein